MNRIWKYDLNMSSGSVTTCWIPIDSKILGVDKQGELLNINVMVNSDNKMVERNFIVFDTDGFEISNKMRNSLFYIGEQKFKNDEYQLHVFEMLK